MGRAERGLMNREGGGLGWLDEADELKMDCRE